MDIVMWEIKYYEQPSGNCPTEIFLDSLDKEKELPYVMFVFDLGEEKGNELRMPHSKPLGDRLFEYRVKANKKLFRFPYFFDNGFIVITHGLIKKSNKLPKGDLAKAKKYRRSYLERR